MNTSSHHAYSFFSVKPRYLVVVGLSLVLGLFCFTSTALGQGGAGLSIKPATIDERLDPGTEKNFTVTLQNLNPDEQTFYVFMRNISGLKEGGVPIFAKEGESTGYEISDWVTVLNNEITLAPNQSGEVNFVMKVPTDASPGSHFGGLFFSVDPPEIESSGAAVAYQVANTIHVRVNGEAVEGATVRQFSTGKYIHGSSNVEFFVRVENTGNVLIRPRGPLEIYNMLGKKVDSVMFNEDQMSVFPNSTRDFFGIKWASDSVGFGRYEAIVSPSYGEAGAIKTMSSTVSFWILPMNIIVPALVTLAVILLIVFVSAKMYINRSLRHLAYDRKIVRRKNRGGSSATLLLVVVMLAVTALFMIVLLALFA